jgi:hypothetical protein
LFERGWSIERDKAAVLKDCEGLGEEFDLGKGERSKKKRYHAALVDLGF